MKKVFIIVAASLLVLGCGENTHQTGNTEPEAVTVTLSAAIGTTDSRVAIHTDDDETFSHFWQTGDRIRVFDGSGHNSDFDLDGYDAEHPSNVANFTGTFSYTVSGAVYPAAASTAFNGSSFTVTFPTGQTYVAGTYDPAANVYVATCDGTRLSFKSLQCYVRVALWSETASTAVDHIVISSVGGEKIAGPASVSTDGTITMDPSASSSITLTCAEPVTLSSVSGSPTCFYVAIPAVEVAEGLKVDVYKSDGSHLWRSVSVSPLDEKNVVLKMGTLEYSPVGTVAATLESGGIVNAILKHLAGDDTTASQAYNVQNTSITKIVLETGKNMTGVKTGTAGTDYHVVSSAGSAQEIVATVKGGVARIQTAADTIAPGSCSYMFMNFRGVTSYEGLNSHFAVGNSYMNYMFRDNVALTSLDLSDITVYNQGTAKYMVQMFYNCPNITSLKLWSMYMFTRDCKQMFYGCSSLATLTNSNKIYSSSSLTSTERMFMGCSSLTSISLSKVNFKINKVTKMGSMFSGCSNLSSLDVSGFNTENVTSMDSLFHNCDALVSLDLSTFDTRKVTTMKYLCNSCDKLTSLDLSGTNCSTAAMSSESALQNLICNSTKVTTLKLGDNFKLESSRFSSGISYLMLPNPDALTGVLTVYSNATIATDLLQQVGNTASPNYRAVDAVKTGKLNFKSLDGTQTWKYYSDSGMTTEITASEVTHESYVGLTL